MPHIAAMASQIVPMLQGFRRARSEELVAGNAAHYWSARHHKRLKTKVGEGPAAGGSNRVRRGILRVPCKHRAHHSRVFVNVEGVEAERQSPLQSQFGPPADKSEAALSDAGVNVLEVFELRQLPATRARRAALAMSRVARPER